ncbi:hypothetical protein HDV03_000108 [Kappamyces sp. JEL0829]|nr:hypothetical protein HDV03_000108 [Kappamyces sp. JEL0829]
MESPVPLPPGFIAQWSAAHSRYFFVDTRTGQSMWELPPVPAAVEASETKKEHPPAYTSAEPPGPAQDGGPFVWARNPVDGSYYKKPATPVYQPYVPLTDSQGRPLYGPGRPGAHLDPSGGLGPMSLAGPLAVHQSQSYLKFPTSKKQ